MLTTRNNLTLFFFLSTPLSILLPHHHHWTIFSHLFLLRISSHPDHLFLPPRLISSPFFPFPPHLHTLCETQPLIQFQFRRGAASAQSERNPNRAQRSPSRTNRTTPTTVEPSRCPAASVDPDSRWTRHSSSSASERARKHAPKRANSVWVNARSYILEVSKTKQLWFRVNFSKSSFLKIDASAFEARTNKIFYQTMMVYTQSE